MLKENAPNKYGRTPLDVATKRGHNEVEILLKNNITCAGGVCNDSL